MIRTCRQCFEEYVAGPARKDDGFCSDPCEAQYDREISDAPNPDPAKLIEAIERRDYFS